MSVGGPRRQEGGRGARVGRSVGREGEIGDTTRYLGRCGYTLATKIRLFHLIHMHGVRLVILMISGMMKNGSETRDSIVKT